MDEIEVDPKLFVTCRLCLEDLGQYQIVPSVQQQIKYCFDIEVEPFDGLPQLICIKCKEILNKFHTIKKTFSEKQTNLIDKVLKKEEIYNSIQPQQDTVTSSQQAPENIGNSKKQKSKKKRVLQSSSSDLESEQSFHTSKPKKKKSLRRRVKTPMPWEADYKKWISCKLCNSVWPNRRSLANHIRSHDHLRERYKNIFNRQSTVYLNKIDGKPNITGMNNMVVHSGNKIISPGNSYFYTIYSKEEEDEEEEEDVAHNFNSKLIQNEYENKLMSRESSDDDEGNLMKLTQRKRRLISKSSNETVVIESNSNKILSDCEEDSKTIAHDNTDAPINTDQCINIDDSSDSESDQGKSEKSPKSQTKQPMEAKAGDYKIIQGIISMCINSYNKKNESAEVDMLYMNMEQNKKKENVQISNESQLKHKVLSIGRKIINKQGFNCTGLLRYMEHKSLEIIWMAKTQSSYSKDTNYIRILTKLRGPGNSDDDFGWVNISKTSESKSLTDNSVIVNNFMKVVAPNKALSTDPVNYDSAKVTTAANKQTKLEAIPAAMIYIDSKPSTSDLKKLLNANPVANPKQLPKKLGLGNDTRSNKTVPHQNTTHNTDDDSFFPIITSTTSLATVPDKEQNQDSNHNNSVKSGVITNTETPAAPRIKVKPVSELMSERTLNCLMKEKETSPVTNSNMLVSQIENVWPHQQQMNVFVPNIASQIHVASPPLQIIQIPPLDVGSTPYPIITQETSNIKDYVVLDTTDFPNTKTISPFKYLKDLLQVHNLVLLDPCEQLSKEFVCLIRFKVVFKQEYQNEEPVILGLSFFYFKNSFCLQFRDRNNQILDINKISANWQWELLEIYRGDVRIKVLLHARKLSQEAYHSTNKFFCIIKSINCLNKTSA